MIQYSKEEIPILQYLAKLMQETNLPVKHIHVLNELLRCAVSDDWEFETGKVLIVSREYRNMVERLLGDDAPTPVNAAITDLQKAGLLQVWTRGSYRFNPDVFGRRPWYIGGKPNIKAVKLVVRNKKNEKKLQTIRTYCGRAFLNKGMSTYRVAC